MGSRERILHWQGDVFHGLIHPPASNSSDLWGHCLNCCSIEKMELIGTGHGLGTPSGPSGWRGFSSQGLLWCCGSDLCPGLSPVLVPHCLRHSQGGSGVGMDAQGGAISRVSRAQGVLGKSHNPRMIWGGSCNKAWLLLSLPRSG